MTCYNDACVNYGIGFSFSCRSMMEDEVFICSIRIESLEQALAESEGKNKRVLKEIDKFNGEEQQSAYDTVCEIHEILSDIQSEEGGKENEL